MSVTLQEVESQPPLWRQAAGVAADVAPKLPSAGQCVALIGCGTSYYIAQAAAALRESAGSGQSDAFVTYRFSYPHFNPARMKSLVAFLIDAEGGVIARAVAWQSSDDAEPRSMAQKLCRALILGEKKTK